MPAPWRPQPCACHPFSPSPPAVSSALHKCLHSEEAQQVFVLPAVRGAGFWGEIYWVLLRVTMFFSSLFLWPANIALWGDKKSPSIKQRLWVFMAILWELVMFHDNHQTWWGRSNIQACEQLHASGQGSLSSFGLLFILAFYCGKFPIPKRRENSVMKSHVRYLATIIMRCDQNIQWLFKLKKFLQ